MTVAEAHEKPGSIRIAWLFGWLLFLASHGVATAGTNEVSRYSMRLWQIDEGLPDNTVQAITQTKDGFLWVGTADGLARFDGVRFSVLDSKNYPEINGHFITDLRETSDGSLWIGVDGGGVARLHHGVFSHLGKKDGLVSDSVKVLYPARDGSLWIGTLDGLSHYADGKFINYVQKDGLETNVIRGIAEDNEGAVWIGTSQGVNRFYRNSFSSYTRKDGLPNGYVKALIVDRTGTVWVGSEGGISAIKNGSVRHFNKARGLADNR